MIAHAEVPNLCVVTQKWVMQPFWADEEKSRRAPQNIVQQGGQLDALEISKWVQQKVENL